jgi:fructose-1-phosphate kinase PfkB-like protein
VTRWLSALCREEERRKGLGVEGLRTAVPSAGDAFGAALVVSLLQGRERGEALVHARAAGAIAGSRPGAQPSLSTAAELEEIMAR